jgi:hypothetical protein
MDTALTLLAAGLILLPGWALWLRITGPQPSTEVAITGLAFATAVAMVALYALSYLSLAAFIVAWLAAAAWGIYQVSVLRPLIRIDRALALLALGAAAIRFAPVLFQDFPPGWDPYFHLLVVRLIEQSGAHVASLSPFEDIPINYPTGTHLLVALIVKCTGASRYGVFQAVLALFGTLTCLQVYAWVSAATANKRWALYAMAAYAFLALQGSIDYYRWGGVPNLVGMYLLAGCLTLVAQRDAGERRWWALPPMYLAIAVSNHHVLFTAFAVMGGLLVWLALDSRRRRDARRLLAGGCIAAVVAVPYLGYHFFSTGGIHDTGLLTYIDEPNALWSIALGYGAVFFLAVLAGIGLYARDPRSRRVGAELLLPAAVMLALFVLFEYGGRQLMLVLYQRPIAPFTPSRFVTDAVYPLSAFAGLAFLELEQRMQRSVLIAVVALFATNAVSYAKQFEPQIDPDRAAAYAWVEANTRPNTLVIAVWVHTPVLTNRASYYTALPSSEQSTKAGNRLLLERMISGEVRVETTSYPVVLINQGPLPPLAPRSAILWQRGAIAVLDVNPSVSALLRAPR